APLLPLLFLFFRPVVGVVDAADVMAMKAIRVAEQERRPAAFARARDQVRYGAIDELDVLSFDRLRRNAERLRARHDLTRGRLAVMRVLVVEVVLAEIDDRQLP